MNPEITRAESIARIIELLTLSQVPPTFQEAVLDSIGELHDNDLAEIRRMLEELHGAENRYLVAAKSYLSLCREIGERIRGRLDAKGRTIREEFEKELQAVEEADN